MELRDYLDSLTQRLDAIQDEMDVLKQEEQALTNLLALHQTPKPVQAPVKKTAKPTQTAKRRPADGKVSKHEQIIELAIQLIKAGGKAITTSDMVKEGAKLGISTASVYTYLSAEVKKERNARLRKVGQGYYDLAGVNRPTMTVDEFNSKVAEAREKQHTDVRI